MIGKIVGSYRIIQELGEGGMGAVYLAEHTLMGKQAAVKVLLPRFCAEQEVVERFFNEARAASMIKHPGIVDVYDFGNQDDGSAFIVMELLQGETLTDLLEREPRLESKRVALLGQQMASALQAAHDLGIVHRDLKPDNIFLEPDSAATGGVRPKILDFGIAKLGGDMTDSSVKTRTGAIMGTPIYMSPEQCTGAGNVDSRSDVYSLGCILYSMVRGQPPFERSGAGALIAAHIMDAPTPPSVYDTHVDRKLEAIIMSTLAKSPDERPQSMNALANALSRISGHKTSNEPGLELWRGESGHSPDSRYAETQVAASSTSTTLGSSMVSVDTSDEARPASAVAKIALAAGILLAAAVAAAFVLRPGDTSAPAEKVAASARPVPQATQPKPTPAAQPVAEATKTIMIEITSEPTGAGVYRRLDGVKLGATPYKGEIPWGLGELELMLQHDDYESVTVNVPLQEDFTNRFDLVGTKQTAERPSTRNNKHRSTKTLKKDASAATSATKKVEPTKVKVSNDDEWGKLAD